MNESAQAIVDASTGRRILNLPECICMARLTIKEALDLLEQMEQCN